MPTNEETKQEVSIKDQPVKAELETEEIALEDAEKIAGGGGVSHFHPKLS